MILILIPGILRMKGCKQRIRVALIDRVNPRCCRADLGLDLCRGLGRYPVSRVQDLGSRAHGCKSTWV